eukprot:Sspe_Gene.103163::Locus_78982_Transcript_1_1_Confidence_1.000_Length_516::g.103163::m.103163
MEQLLQQVYTMAPLPCSSRTVVPTPAAFSEGESKHRQALNYVKAILKPYVDRGQLSRGGFASISQAVIHPLQFLPYEELEDKKQALRTATYTQLVAHLTEVRDELKARLLKAEPPDQARKMLEELAGVSLAIEEGIAITREVAKQQ